MPQKLGIRELAEKAKKEGAYDLAQGVIDADPPEVLKQALLSLPFKQASIYNNKRGAQVYREAVQHYLASQSWDLPLESIAGTAGVVGGMVAALLADVRPGKRVVLPEPFFVGHKLMLEALGFDIDYVPFPLQGHPDWDVLEEKMVSGTAVIITTPLNPTGYITPTDVLIRLSNTAAANNSLLLIDEVYREFMWDRKERDNPHREGLNLKNTCVFRSFSKTLAIPGWRIGHVITSPERIERMATSHDALYIGGSTLAQYAIADVLTNDRGEIEKYISNLRATLEQNRDTLADAFTRYGMELILPIQGAYYMMIKHNRKSDMAAMEELLKKKIVVTPANILYSNSSQDTGYIRIHFAISKKTADAVVKILRT